MFSLIVLLILGESFNYNAILDDYQIIEEIGKGGFGTVMLARHKEDKKEVAIKFMDISENCNYQIAILLINVKYNSIICQQRTRDIQGGRIAQEAYS